MRGWRRGLPRPYWVIWSGILVNRAGGFAVLFLSLYLTGPRGLSPALAGAVAGGFGLGNAAGTLLGGVLADRWGRRRTLLLAHLGGAALLAALGLVPYLPVLAALAVLVGVAQGMPGPAFVAAIVDVVPAPRRPHAFNLQFWAFNLGTAAAGLIAGGLARLGFLPLFLTDAGTTLVTGLLILLWVPESAPHRVAGDAPPPRGGLRTALTDRIFLVFVGLALVQAVLSAQSSTILPLQMRVDGLSPSGYGLVMAWAGGLIVVGQLFVPALIAGRRKARVLALSLVLTGLGYGSVSVAGSLTPYLACATVWTVGAMLAAPPNATIMAELAPPLLRARYQAVFFLTFALAGFVAPALGGLSWQHLGSAYWLVIGAAGLLAAVGHLAAGPARERRVAATDPAVPEVGATLSEV